MPRSVPRSFLVKSLSDFVAGLNDDLLLCPVRLRIYFDRTLSLAPSRRRLFVSPSCPTRAMSKNAVSFFLREVIHGAAASRPEVGLVRAHDICGVSTSVAFHRNWSVSAVLDAATWSSSSVFTSFYLHDLQHEFQGLRSLGPFVAAGSRIALYSPLPDLLWRWRRFYVALVPAAPRLQGLFSVTGCGGLPFQFLCGSWGFPFSCFLLHFYCLCILFICIMCVPA